MHRATVTRSWGPLLCHSSAAITSSFSMIMHGPMSVHNSWKLKLSQFFHGLHTHQTCHPLSMFEILWINVYDSMFHFLPISSNFAQPQSAAWSTLCEGDVSRCMRQVVTPETDWYSDPGLYLFLRYLWPTDANISSQSYEIYSFGPNEFI